ncbi:hypothetical protein QLX08_009791 [Tetragonisca angustula]|uniref:Uncharacterized protein n=1 Tax=Tetragonisca angustula TaxID=166442 RepID=A0AAW0ZFG5_9HYME
MEILNGPYGYELVRRWRLTLYYISVYVCLRVCSGTCTTENDSCSSVWPTFLDNLSVTDDVDRREHGSILTRTNERNAKDSHAVTALGNKCRANRIGRFRKELDFDGSLGSCGCSAVPAKNFFSDFIGSASQGSRTA